jgi:Mlc titration factor MtfA (ptsG expression regulator)
VFGSRRKRIRRPAPAAEFPAAWRARLAVRWPTWSTLTDDEQARLEDLILAFIVNTRWESAKGFVMTDEVQLVIAAQACLLVLELDIDMYRRVDSIIVHPRTVVLHGERYVGSGMVADGPHAIAGQAHHHAGPILISWSTAAFEARHTRSASNVVYHELAHKIDMLDGVVDGTPPIADPAQRARWIEVCTAEYERLCHGRASVLRDYAATDAGEFFAVATEQFFTQPVALRDGNADLYEVLMAFYRQDPAARALPAR